MINEITFTKEQFNSFIYTLLFKFSLSINDLNHLSEKTDLTDEEKQQIINIHNKIENFNKQQDEKSI